MAKPAEILYGPRALADLEEILDYIRQDSPARAERFLNKVHKAVSRLARFPLLGSVPKDERLKNTGYRVLIVEDYLIFYVPKGSTVRIRRVIHGARRYAFLL